MTIPRLDVFEFLFNMGRGIRKNQVDWSTDDAAFDAAVTALLGTLGNVDQTARDRIAALKELNSWGTAFPDATIAPPDGRRGSLYLRLATSASLTDRLVEVELYEFDPDNRPVNDPWVKRIGINVDHGVPDWDETDPAERSYIRNKPLTRILPDPSGATDGHVAKIDGGAWVIGNDEVGSPGSGEANVQSNWDETDTSSDAYIQNKPTVPSSFAPTNAEQNVQSDWDESNSSSDAFIQNKPTIPAPTPSDRLLPANAGNGQVAKWNGSTWVAADDEVGSPGSGEANVQADWNVTNTASDAYIRNKPALAPSNAEQNVQSDWNVTNSGSDAYIRNKPTIPTERTLEQLQDAVAAMFAGVSQVTYNDATGTFTIDIPSPSGNQYFPVWFGARSAIGLELITDSLVPSYLNAARTGHTLSTDQAFVFPSALQATFLRAYEDFHEQADIDLLPISSTRPSDPDNANDRRFYRDGQDIQVTVDFPTTEAIIHFVQSITSEGTHRVYDPEGRVPAIGRGGFIEPSLNAEHNWIAGIEIRAVGTQHRVRLFTDGDQPSGQIMIGLGPLGGNILRYTMTPLSTDADTYESALLGNVPDGTELKFDVSVNGARRTLHNGEHYTSLITDQSLQPALATVQERLNVLEATDITLVEYANQAAAEAATVSDNVIQWWPVAP